MGIAAVTDESFEKEVLEEKEFPVLVDFWAEWCGPCRMLAPVIESLSEKLKNSLKVRKLDTDANPETAQTYQITGIPCCILFQNGKEIKRVIGYKPQAAFEAELASFLKET